MNETKIKGLKILYDDDKIEIYKSYQLKSKEKICQLLENIFSKNEFTNINKPVFLIYEEWKFQNLLYKWNIFKKKTENYIITNKTHILPFLKCYVFNRKVVKEWKKKKK